MERLNSQSGIFRRSTVICLSFIFCLIASATVIPDDTTIVGDLTIQTTNGIDINPGSDADADLVSVGVTGSPKIKWDESEDAFQVIEKLLLGTNASLTKTVNGSSITSKMSLDTNTTTDSGGIDITRHGSSDPSYGVINMYRSRGTHGSEAVVQSGDLISSIVGLGFDGTDYEPVAAINMYSDGTPGSNDMPGRIDFKTVADGSRVLNQVMRVGQNTDVMIGTTTSEASSIFEVQSLTRGSRPAPRMQQTERNNITSPATGLMAYNTDFNTYDFYNGSGWLNFLDTGTTQEFSGKTVTDSLKFKETGGGSNYSAFQAPSSLTGDVTFTLPDGDGSAGQVLSTNGSGTLSWANGGSGSGGINYLDDNPDAEAGTTGWATYADSAGTSPVDGTGGSATTTWTQTSSSPLRGTYSFLLTKDAANRQGEGVSYDFTISAADKAKVLQVSFDYIVGSGTFAAGSSSSASDVTVWLYDVTNSQVIQPSSYKLLSSSTSIASKFDATFQTASDSTSYRLILHVGSTSSSAYTVKFDNFIVGPSTYVYGTPITDWESFTPTGSWSTNTTYTGFKRRVGDNEEYDVLVSLSGAPTATVLTINIANSKTIDTSKITGTSADTSDFGFGSALDSGVQNYPKLKVGYNSSTSVIVYAPNASGTYLTGVGVSNTAPITFGSGDSVHLKYSVPITGWSSSVQMSDKTDSRVVSFVGTQVSEAVTANTTNIAFTLSKDTHGGWSTNTYTVQVPGDYVVAGSLVTNTSGLTVVPYLNGSATSFLWSTANSSGHVTAGSSLYPNLKTGDIISVRSNTSATLTSGSLQIFRLSGPSAIAATETVVARYSTSAGQSIPDSTVTIVDFGTKSFDTLGSVTTGSSWKFTAPISGYYSINSRVLLSSGAGWASTERVLFHLYKNGSAYSILDYNPQHATNTSINMNASGQDIVQLNSGDYVDIRVEQNSGGSIALNNSALNNFINIQRVK